MTHKKWKTTDEFPGSISLPFGVKTSHTWHEIGQILRIINDLDVYTFIELGCHVGGLASALMGRSRFHPFRYIGYEIQSQIIDDVVKESCTIFSKDIFENPKSVVDHADAGRTFIYCDNGDKVQEMEVFSKHLRPGDVIACHDYFDNQVVVGLDNFGFSDECGCKPEVWRENVQYLYDDPTFEVLSDVYLQGTRIIGFVKQ